MKARSTRRWLNFALGMAALLLVSPLFAPQLLEANGGSVDAIFAEY